MSVRCPLLCVGLDPFVDRLPPAIRRRFGSSRGGEARAVKAFLEGVVEAVAPYASAVKPQLALFERLGSHGFEAYEAVVLAAKRCRLFVIADGKRGDIGSTAAAYAEAFLVPRKGSRDVSADALTVNPYLGEEGLRPFVECVRAHGKSLFVLVRTSNPGASEIQGDGRDPESVCRRVASLVRRLGEEFKGKDGWSRVGAVVGATSPAEIPALRQAMPLSPFLIPGVGAQGGRVEDLRPAFDARGHGGLVNASRSILYPDDKHGRPWQEAVASAAKATARTLDDLLVSIRGASPPDDDGDE